jgi:hypothetical protein
MTSRLMLFCKKKRRKTKVAQFIGKPKKFVDYTDNFHIKQHVHEETTDASLPAMPAWSTPYPESWDKQAGHKQRRITTQNRPNNHIVLPSIPTIVGYLVISGCCGYTAYEVICLLVKAFPQAIK